MVELQGNDDVLENYAFNTDQTTQRLIYDCERKRSGKESYRNEEYEK